MMVIDVDRRASRLRHKLGERADPFKDLVSTMAFDPNCPSFTRCIHGLEGYEIGAFPANGEDDQASG
jgi:hypothetical protein